MMGGVLRRFPRDRDRINAITTLSTLAIFSGLAELITNGVPIRLAAGMLADPVGVRRPWNLHLRAFIVSSVFILRMTVFGRSLYAIGSNRLAARLAGIRVGRTIFAGFVLSGFAVGIAGLVAASQTGEGSGTTGTGYELTVVTAVILGGASLAGGRGSIFGTVIGLLILGIIDNGLTLLNVESFWQDVVRGSLLISAVGFDAVRRRLTEE